MQIKKIKSQRVQYLGMKRVSLIRDKFRVKCKAVILHLRQTQKKVFNKMNII